jgi:hypothetical protein
MTAHESDGQVNEKLTARERAIEAMRRVLAYYGVHTLSPNEAATAIESVGLDFADAAELAKLRRINAGLRRAVVCWAARSPRPYRYHERTDDAIRWARQSSRGTAAMGDHADAIRAAARRGEYRGKR